MALSAKTEKNKTSAAPDRNATFVLDGLVEFETTNQTENAAKSSTSTTQKNGGQATAIKASAIQDVIFLSNNVQRFFKCGEATIASRSKKLPKYKESPDAKYRAAGFIGEIVSSAPWADHARRAIDLTHDKNTLTKS